MSPLKVLLIVCLLRTVNADCEFNKWNFFKLELHMCHKRDYYIQGISRRVEFNKEEDYIRNIQGATCCSSPSQWSNVGIQVVYPDWWSKIKGYTDAYLDNLSDYYANKYGYIGSWALCPSGYFLQGFVVQDEGRLLSNIVGARCTKPTNHPFYYGHCYLKYIYNSTVIINCKENYFVTGMYKSKCTHLYCLEMLRCCEMAETHEVINEVSAIKTRIMDTTLWSMANLAHLLGYNWCLGCSASDIGEDFYREGDTWKANTKDLFQGKCGKERLILDFADWRFDVKQIKYGQSVDEHLPPESISTGVIYNKEPRPVTEKFHITESVEATITHSTTSIWKNSHELGITLDFNIPLINTGMSLEYKTKFEKTTQKVDEMSKSHVSSFTKETSKTLAPFSAARYELFVNKVKTTIPYTATIIAKFSTEFRGLLTEGEGYSSPSTNYHYTYKGSKDFPTFNYRFGDKSIPFYTALKREMEHQSKPWLWKEMMDNRPKAKHFIKQLTNESQYEFTLEGKLEYKAGSNIQVVWETVNFSGLYDSL